jgi:hypothetical protein
MEMLDFSWRDGVLLIAGIAGIYLALLVLRLLKVGKSSAKSPVAVPRAPTIGDTDGLVDLSRDVPPGFMNEQTPAPTEREWPIAGFAAAGATAWAAGGRVAAPSNEAPADFAGQLQRSHVEVDVQQLRRESAALREELARMREEMASLKAAQNVSPLYSAAMSLAQNGVTADGIAGQCGISLAEAQLVAALARGETQDEPYPSGEEPNDGYPDPRSRTGTHG